MTRSGRIAKLRPFFLTGVFLVLFGLSCKPQEFISQKSHTPGTSSETKIEGEKSDSEKVEEDVEGVEFETGQKSQTVTGVNLTFANARLHCERNPGQIICRVVAEIGPGRWAPPAGREPGLVIKWSVGPLFKGCVDPGDVLVFQCSFEEFDEIESSAQISFEVINGQGDVRRELPAFGGNTSIEIVSPNASNTVLSLEIRPMSLNLAVGGNEKFQVFAIDSSGERDVTAQASWASIDNTIASVGTNSGQVSGLKNGFSSVKASFNGREASANVAVIGVWGQLLGSSGSLGGPEDQDEIFSDVFGTVSGNVFAVGTLHGSRSGGTSFGRRDAYLVKLDLNGDVLWDASFGSSQDDFGKCVILDATEVVVFGDVGNGPADGETGFDSDDIMAVKFNRADGTRVLYQRITLGGRQTVSACAKLPLGAGYIVVGQSEGTATVDDTNGFVARLSSAGTLTWIRYFGAHGELSYSDDGGARDVKVVGNRVYVLGALAGPMVKDDPGYNGDHEGVLLHYNLEGDLLNKQYLGSIGPDEPRSLALNADHSRIYVVGATSGTISGQISAGSDDAFVMAFDANFLPLWQRQYGCDTKEEATGVVVQGNFIHVGGVAKGRCALGSTQIDDGGFLLKLDSSGNNPTWSSNVPSGGGYGKLKEGSDGSLLSAGRAWNTIFGQSPQHRAIPLSSGNPSLDD